MATVTENSNSGSRSDATSEPRGFGQHTRGLAGEYAHEQGWRIDEDQRRKLPEGPQNTDGGTDYEYGARDFGDEPVNTAAGHDETRTVDDARKKLMEENA